MHANMHWLTSSALVAPRVHICFMHKCKCIKT
uniref:Uncharacterized protein n=1 Tax=Amphimedon queenslandica TaxID=400682 RepID=A0A1X7V8S1_AMPQE